MISRVGLLLFVLLSACNSSKYLGEGQYLLKKQDIKFLDAKDILGKGDLKYEMLRLSPQKPNTNFLFFFPKEYFYLANSKARDTTGLDKILRNLGQPPSLYDDSASELGSENMRTYLQYQGYLEAEVYHETTYKKNSAQLIYYAKPGKQTIIRQLHYQSSQPKIDSLLQLAKEASLLAVGEVLDLNALAKEKERLSTFLRNHGYAYVNSSAFDQLEVDTFKLKNQADIYLRLLSRKDNQAHIQYRIGRVDVYPDYSLTTTDGELIDSMGLSPTQTLDTFVDGVHFSYQQGWLSISPNVLLNNIFFRPGDYYSKESYDRTNTQLGQLGLFNFTRINLVEDTAEAGVLNYVLQLPLKPKMEIATSFDIGYTNRATTGADNLIGFGINPSYSNRNLFGGAQLLVFNLNAGIEVDPGLIAGGDSAPDDGASNRFFNTFDLGANVSLYLPRFRDLLGIYKVSRALLNKKFYQGLQDKGSTRFSVGFERLFIIDYYAFTQANARFGYNYSPSAVNRYTINQAALDLLRPTTEPLFDEILEQNEFLSRSFGQQYFVSLLFRDFNYQRTGKVDRRGRSVNFTGYFEASGWELEGLNALFKLNSSSKGILDSTNQIAQYFRLRLDTRFYKKYNEQSSFASRLMFSIAKPFGSDRNVPYVKQFSVGGANSMRAWAPRGLGPGGFLDSLSLRRDRGSNLLLYQTGDLHLELNLEYRFQLYSFVKSTFFLDIGNVWTLEKDEERCGSQFRFSRTSYPCGEEIFHHQPFYKQIAVGAGTGLRMDLSYFIFRLDVSVPLRFNYPSERLPGVEKLSESLYWNDFSSNSFGRSLVWQLGLGYPF